MANELDFSSLSLRDALDLAVLIEEEAKERYDDFAAQMDAHHTPDAAAFFRRMSANELKHAEKISAKRSDRFGEQPVTVDRSQLFDVEAPEFDQARAFMTTHRALEVALDSETKAREFYEGALTTVEDSELRELFVWLRDEEIGHQQMVRTLMAKVPAEGNLDPDDFVDPPTAQ